MPTRSRLHLFMVPCALALLLGLLASPGPASRPARAEAATPVTIWIPVAADGYAPSNLDSALPPELLGKPIPVANKADAFFEGTIYDSTKKLAIWLPPNRKYVHGIFFANGTPNRPNPSDPDWRNAVAQDRMLAARQLASLWGFAFISGDTWDVPDQSAFFDAALHEFAARTGHAELLNAPLAIDGGSRFTQFCLQKVLPRFAGRVIGCSFYSTYSVSTNPAYMAIPAIAIVGENDHGADVVANSFMQNRAQGGLTGIAMMWGVDHKCDHCQDLSWPFLNQLIHARLPADADPRAGVVPLRPYREDEGYLGNVSAWGGFAPYQSYTGDKQRAAWFPNKYVAMVWNNFVVNDPPVRITAPTSPYRWSNGFSQEPSSRRARDPLTLVAAITRPVPGDLTFYDGDVALGKGSVSSDGKSVTLTNLKLAPGLHSFLVMSGATPVSWPADIILLP